MIPIYELFKAEVCKQKRLRRLNNKKLAEMTGFTKSTIDAFMCGVRDSDSVAIAIARVLDIEI